MKKADIRIIYLLLIIIVICTAILIYKLNSTPKYDEQLYSEIYEEYNQIKVAEEKVNNNENNQPQPIELKQSLRGDIYRVIATLGIKKINLSCPVIYESTDAYLEISPTKLYGPDPNQIGNFCIVGHNYKDGKHFGDLDLLENGDIVKLTDMNGNTKQYKVYNTYEVSATDVSCTNQNTNGKVELTLITCTNNRNRRLVVKCAEVS